MKKPECELGDELRVFTKMMEGIGMTTAALALMAIVGFLLYMFVSWRVAMFMVLWAVFFTICSVLIPERKK